MPTPTPLLGLNKAHGTDNWHDYLKTMLAASLDVLDQAVTLTGAQTLTNKTLTNPVLTGVSFLNLVTNPGLEIWQRGAGPFTSNGLMTADRWVISLPAGSTLSVSPDTANADAGSLYCAACTYTHVGGTNNRLQQGIEDYAQLRGRTVTFSARVRSGGLSQARVSVWDSVNGFRYSAYHSGSGFYETLSVTAPIAAAATGVQVGLHLEVSGVVH